MKNWGTQLIRWCISDSCNLKCKHCLASNALNRSYTTYSEAEKCVDRFRENNVSDVTLFGGEPLLNPNIRGIIQLLKSAGMNAVLLTNGTNLNHELADYFVTVASPSTYVFSVHSHIPHTHNSMCGVSSYAKVIRNLTYLIEVKTQNSLEYAIKINLVLNKMNHRHVIDTITYFLDLGVDNIILSQLVVAGNAEINSYLALSADELLRISDDLLTHPAIRENLYRITFKYLPNYAVSYFRKKFDLNLPITFRGCTFPRELYLDSGSHIFPCQCLLDDNSMLKILKINFNNNSLLHHSIDSILSNRHFSRLYKLCKNGCKLFSLCRSCEFAKNHCNVCPRHFFNRKGGYGLCQKVKLLM